MSSFSGTCEIVEAKDELKFDQRSRGNYGLRSSVGDKDHKHSVLKLKGKESLEDDINQLFEAIALKNSSKVSFSSQEGTTPLPLRKNALKEQITMGMPNSLRVGNPEAVSLKQALRDLCISKASEMAAMKRPSRISEAGKIKSLYETIVIEENNAGSSKDDSKRCMLEISLVPEESRGNSEMISRDHQVPKIKPSMKHDQPSFQQNGKDTKVLPSDVVSRSKHPQTPEIKISNQSGSSSQNVAELTENSTQTTQKQNEVVSMSKNVVLKTLKMELEQEDRYSPPPSPSCSDTAEERPEVNQKVSIATKLAKQASGTKLGRNGKLQTSSSCSSASGHRVGKQRRNTPRITKSVLRNRTFVKRKIQESNSGSYNSKGDKKLNPSASELVCQRCRCNMKDTSSSSCSSSSSSTSMSDGSNLSVSGYGNRPHMSKDVRWEAIRHVRGVLNLNHFNLLKKLGCGDIGSVYLAELIDTNWVFAIKVMDNELLAKRKKMARAQTEREIVGMLDHPFLPTLYAQFTTDHLSCLVMEYCPGGDLHVLRQKQPGRSYSEQAARFYVAEVLLALEYLHMLGVVYRDLKPENVLVREDGHIMLTDFDLSLRCSVSPTLIKLSSTRVSDPCASSICSEAQCFTPRFLPTSAKARKLKADLAAQRRSMPQLVAEPTDARSNSFVGTHEYLAPEIIKGKGHGAAVDWWTFGIFLYELLYGRTPFKGCENEETLANVVLQTLRFPDGPIVSLEARDLIRNLLVKDPEKRLGSKKGAAEIKQHPFFEGLNWALIRCGVPPELPEDHRSVAVNERKYLECKATGEHLEFELF